MVDMTRYDYVFAGTRLIGIFLASEFVLSIPGMFRQLFSWSFAGGFWGVIYWLLTGFVVFVLTFGTAGIMEILGESPPEGAKPVGSDKPVAGR